MISKLALRWLMVAHRSFTRSIQTFHRTAICRPGIHRPVKRLQSEDGWRRRPTSCGWNDKEWFRSMKPDLVGSTSFRRVGRFTDASSG